MFSGVPGHFVPAHILTVARRRSGRLCGAQTANASIKSSIKGEKRVASPPHRSPFMQMTSLHVIGAINMKD